MMLNNAKWQPKEDKKGHLAASIKLLTTIISTRKGASWRVERGEGSKTGPALSDMQEESKENPPGVMSPTGETKETASFDRQSLLRK
jgi:hypothetical protein